MASAPDCAWCSAAGTLELIYAEMGAEYYTCSCCSKLTRVPFHGQPEKSDVRWRSPLGDQIAPVW